MFSVKAASMLPLTARDVQEEAGGLIAGSLLGLPRTGKSVDPIPDIEASAWLMLAASVHSYWG